jgi:[ribosomal protein S18]-alanine N-acetyltransferase
MNIDLPCNSVEIQPASVTLAPVIAGLHAACFGPACWSEDQVKGSLMLATTKAWIALADKVAAGFLLCQMTGSEAEILTFGVHPLYQHQGIGLHLVQHMLASLPPSGTAFLEVAFDNTAARALYAKCGFVRTSTRKGYYKKNNKLIDAVCYRFPA